MKVVFRVDSAFSIGGGHLMRCLSLAECLLNQAAQVSFICRDLPGNLMSLLQNKKIPVSVLPALQNNLSMNFEGDDSFPNSSQAQDAVETIKQLEFEKPDWLIVDHYQLGIEWEKALRPYSNQLLVIEDLDNRGHDCDVLLDQNYSLCGTRRYEGLIPPSCKLLLGPRYALLRRDFEVLRQSQLATKKSLRRILVFFTAGDDQGQTLNAMKGISLFGKSEGVDVVVGKANGDIDAIKQMCFENHWGFHCEINYMPTLIAQADLVIGAGGLSNWERCALGVPALVVILSENQAEIVSALDNAGVVINLGWSDDVRANDYAVALDQITPEQLLSLSRRAFDLVDARGIHRVVEILVAEQKHHSV